MPVSFAKIVTGKKYSRNELAKLWGYAGTEAISRGVVTPAEDNKIILFVTHEKRDEDEQYEDELVGHILLWEGPNNHGSEDRMLAHQENGDEIHLFYREQHRDDFTYAGQLQLYCCQRLTDAPSRFAFRVLEHKPPA